jgi:citrate synthase
VTEWIGAAEAADRLGIKPASLYAYVSRGVLTRRREADGRASMFDADEVENLARRGRPRRPAGSAELVIESALTEITARTQRYRGHDATDLALRRSFEDVALLLWTGSLPERALGAGSARQATAGSQAAPGLQAAAGLQAGPDLQAQPGLQESPVRQEGPASQARPALQLAAMWQATTEALAAGRAAQAALPTGTLPLERL